MSVKLSTFGSAPFRAPSCPPPTSEGFEALTAVHQDLENIGSASALNQRCCDSTTRARTSLKNKVVSLATRIKKSAINISAPEPANTQLGLEQQSPSTASSHSINSLLEFDRFQISVAQRALINIGLPLTPEESSLSLLSKQLAPSAFLKGERDATKAEMLASKQMIKVLTELIADALMRKGTPPKKALCEAKAAFSQARLEVLNSKDWQTIETRLTHGGRTYVSTLVPASQMKLGDQDIFRSSYANKGVSSGSTKEMTHATNLWISEIREPDGQSGDNGKLLYKGVRHGILSPYGCDHPSEREEGALSRAQEVVTAALFSKTELLNRALSGEEVPLWLTSSSLVTPGMGGEGNMLDEQMTAWHTLSKMRQPISLKVHNKAGELCTVKLNLKVAAFNFGVNEAALKLKFGQEQSDKYNVVAMRQLLGNDLSLDAKAGGWVGEYLKDNPDNQARVQELVHQLKTIWADKSHHRDGGEPYKAAQRVAMLAFEIGAVPCSNCKSGKDRTGMLDAELKREAVAQHQGRGLSQPGSRLNEADRNLMQEVLMNGGNFEVQKYNTGAPGNKVMKTLPVMNLSYTDRIGNPEVWKQTQGLSRLVKS